MRGGDYLRFQTGQHFYRSRFFSGREFMKLERKRLFEEFVIARFIDRLQKLCDSFAAENFQRLLATINSGRPLESKEQRRQTCAVIEMQVANPYGVKIHPVKILLRHSMRRVSAAIKQHRAAARFQPKRRGGAPRVRNRSA